MDRNGTIVVADATNALVQVWTVEGTNFWLTPSFTVSRWFRLYSCHVEVNLDRNSSSLGTHEDQSFIKMEEFL